MDLTNQYCYFYENEKFNDTDRAGFRRRVINGELLQLFFWRISGGSSGSVLHHHPQQEQIGIIVRGNLDFRIGEPDDKTRVTLGPGEIYLAPRSVWHGDSVFVGDDELNEVWILDVFSPPREDLLNG
jgi:hypothetical protein